MGADILLFPECFITGYGFPISYETLPDDNSPYLAAFREKAKELHMGAVITSFTKGKEKPCNTAYVISRDGEILLKYNKVHTCDFSDERCLESGDEFFVCTYDGVKLGVMICYDREYPESARILMLKGAELILVPNDCGSMQPRLRTLSTRAYENMTGIAMANPPGKNAGNSCAYSPIAWDGQGTCIDNTIFTADEMTSKIYIAPFDMNTIRKYRSSEMMGNTFRKPAAYKALLTATIEEPFIREDTP